MTTILYSNGEIASDSLITGGNQRIGYGRKIGTYGNKCFGASGTARYTHEFIQWGFSGFEGDPPKIDKADDQESGCEGFIGEGNRITCYVSRGIETFIADEYAIGSGADYALGAFKAGASINDAVKIAIHYDVKSGGDINYLKIG